MAVPTYDQFIDPLLRVLVSHPEGISAPDAHEKTAARIELTDEDKAELLPSGRQATYKNRIGWAHDRLKRASFSSSPKRALWVVTEAGIGFAAGHPGGVSPELIEKLSHPPADSRLRPLVEGVPETPADPVAVPARLAGPEERIDQGVTELHESVAADLLDLIASSSPDFFERLVLAVLHALGYGADQDALQKVGRSGDGGIDGIISLDSLGLEKVYVQAKRWKTTVGRPEIQAFFGALAGHRATKGIFVTTSSYSREAKEYAQRVSDSLVLVDGAHLTELMIKHGVGVSHRAIQIAQVDSDFFEDG